MILVPFLLCFTNGQTTQSLSVVSCQPIVCYTQCTTYARDTNGCQVCACDPSSTAAPVACKPTLCGTYCSQYQVDSNGCQLCACSPLSTPAPTTGDVAASNNRLLCQKAKDSYPNDPVLLLLDCGNLPVTAPAAPLLPYYNFPYSYPSSFPTFPYNYPSSSPWMSYPGFPSSPSPSERTWVPSPTPSFPSFPSFPSSLGLGRVWSWNTASATPSFPASPSSLSNPFPPNPTGPSSPALWGWSGWAGAPVASPGSAVPLASRWMGSSPVVMARTPYPIYDSAPPLPAPVQFPQQLTYQAPIYSSGSSAAPAVVYPPASYGPFYKPAANTGTPFVTLASSPALGLGRVYRPIVAPTPSPLGANLLPTYISGF